MNIHMSSLILILMLHYQPKNNIELKQFLLSNEFNLNTSLERVILCFYKACLCLYGITNRLYSFHSLMQG